MSVSDRPGSRPNFVGPGSFVRDFREGFLGPLHALRYVARRPSLWKYSAASAALSLLILMVLAGLGLGFSDELLSLIWARPEAWWLQVVWWLLLLLVVGGALVAAFGVTMVLVGVLLGPFMDALSERVEVGILNNAVAQQGTLVGAVSDVAKGISHQLLTLGLYVVLMCCTLLLHLLPVVGSLAAAGCSAMLSAGLLSMEFSDQPQSRRGFTWREKQRLLRAQPGAMLGLGAGIAALLFVPVLDFFLVPIAIVAGTMVFCGLDEAGRVTASDRRRPVSAGTLAQLPFASGGPVSGADRAFAGSQPAPPSASMIETTTQGVE